MARAALRNIPLSIRYLLAHQQIMSCSLAASPSRREWHTSDEPAASTTTPTSVPKQNWLELVGGLLSRDHRVAHGGNELAGALGARILRRHRPLEGLPADLHQARKGRAETASGRRPRSPATTAMPPSKPTTSRAFPGSPLASRWPHPAQSSEKQP